MAEPRVVTFTSDFGLQDPFVGIMHGVVLNIHPETRIVDVSHSVASYDLRDGAWTIAQAYRFFPPRTVHVVVVDPGVGSARRPLLAETDDYIFVAPDNGVLTLVEARETRFTVRHITADRYFLQPVSQTFHGRDVFSPVAGWLSKGIAPADFGPEVSDYVRLQFPVVERVAANGLRGTVIRVDKFGNLITNLSELDVAPILGATPPRFELLLSGASIKRISHSYADGGEDEVFAILGSSGYLEIAARQASAAQKLQAGVGTPVGLVIEG
jgi:S-adenosyl-L-methionine hydrolase (adenosine-forming)